MVMYKIASSSDWTGSNDRNVVEVKVSSRGFLPGDSRKIAAEVGDRFVAEVRKIEKDLDPINHKYSHVVSCGSTEVTGSNRNGDGWGAAALERDMHTYLKYAKCFRDHKSGKNDNFYGRPKKVAFYDRDRGYGRVLAEYFATDKAASEENAKIADLEIAALERGEDTKVSHGVKISHDTCSICGNNSEKRSQYCESKSEGGKCRLFGCKRGLSKISEDGEMQFVHNDDNNVFYDLSSIGLDKFAGSARQADRVAYATLYDVAMDKVAAYHDYVPGSAWLAEQLKLPVRDDLILDIGLSPHEERLMKVAMQLEELESHCSELLDDYSTDVTSLRWLSASDSLKVAAAKDMANHQEMVGPRLFAKLYGADEQLANKVASCSRGIYGKLRRDGKMASFIRSSVFTRSPLIGISSGLGISRLPGAKLGSDAGQRRLKFAALQPPGNCHCDDDRAAAIALQYAAFKLSVASHISSTANRDLGFLA